MSNILIFRNRAVVIGIDGPSLVVHPTAGKVLVRHSDGQSAFPLRHHLPGLLCVRDHFLAGNHVIAVGIHFLRIEMHIARRKSV